MLKNDDGNDFSLFCAFTLTIDLFNFETNIPLKSTRAIQYRYNIVHYYYQFLCTER